MSPRDDHFQDITIAGNVSIAATTVVEGNWLPDTDDLRTLGDATHRWANLFTTNINTQGIISQVSSLDSTDTPYTQSASDHILIVDATSANITINLLDATLHQGRRLLVKKVDSGTNTVTLDGSGAQTIDGSTTWELVNEDQYVEIVSDGSQWHIIANN